MNKVALLLSRRSSSKWKEKTTWKGLRFLFNSHHISFTFPTIKVYILKVQYLYYVVFKLQNKWPHFVRSYLYRNTCCGSQYITHHWYNLLKCTWLIWPKPIRNSKERGTEQYLIRSICKEPMWCNLAVCLLVTAIILYMFRTLFASILRIT